MLLFSLFQLSYSSGFEKFVKQLISERFSVDCEKKKTIYFVLADKEQKK